MACDSTGVASTVVTNTSSSQWSSFLINLHYGFTPLSSCQRQQVDSYSGFFDNYKDRATGLGDELVKRGVTDVFVCGLAYDYCAGSSACDAAELG